MNAQDPRCAFLLCLRDVCPDKGNRLFPPCRPLAGLVRVLFQFSVVFQNSMFGEVLPYEFHGFVVAFSLVILCSQKVPKMEKVDGIG